MNAMIFAAGLGTRLKPLTNDRPKALVEVGGKSLLEWNIQNLKRAGFEHIVVNVHHFGEQIISFLEEKNNFGIDIRISDERECLLDTGGGIRKALSLFDDDKPVLIHNVDIISTAPLLEIYQTHKNTGANATLCVAERQTSRYLLFDSVMRMQGWMNVKTGETRPGQSQCQRQSQRQLAFSGIHVISQSLFHDLTSFPKDIFSITDFYIQTCSTNDYRAFLLPKDVRWVDCGKPESLETAANILIKE